MQYATVLKWKEETRKWAEIVKSGGEQEWGSGSSVHSEPLSDVEALLKYEDRVLPELLNTLSSVCFVFSFHGYRVSALVIVAI